MFGEGSERMRLLLQRAGLGSVSPRVLAGIGVVAACIVASAAVRWLSGGTDFAIESGTSATVPVTAVAAGGAERVGAGEGAATPTGGESAEPTSVVVHVVGAVRRPGVVSLPVASRVADAVAAAGGLLSNAAQESLNLAEILVDGQQVVVLSIDEWEAAGTPGAGAAPGSGSVGGPGAARVNINTASAAQLEDLPGIGPSTAAKIIEDREANGSFDAAEDLMRVSGIGPKKFEALKDAVVVR